TPIATAPSTMDFTVNIYDGSNNVAGSTSVTVHPYPAAPVVTLQGNMLVSSYETGNQWFDDNGMVPGATAKTFIPGTEGNYYATHTSEYNCESEASNVIHYVPVGIGNAAATDDLKVYPNPFSGQLNITYTLTKSSPVQITVWNNLGQLVGRVADEALQTAGRYDVRFDGSTQEPGIYFVRFNTGNNSSVFRVVLSK
ncbi:MAG: T9SS type A sorting domain-containing protein, partial [Bacteroidales bacterium]|nr:T9SS type A sorting domain-containing protein [Bacteroidales bacterium]